MGATFAERLREVRERVGVSQEALARMTGIHRVTIFTLEKSASDPRLSTILRLASGLGVPPRELVEEQAGRRHDEPA